MNKKVDYLIIGQGIAGSILAYQLIQKNHSVLVFDMGLKNSSTYVAAGVMNPLVLKRFTLTWRAQEFIDFNVPFYKELEHFLDEKFFYEAPLYKLIQSEDEKDFWQHRIKKANLEDFMEVELIPAPKAIKPATDYWMGKVKQTAWLDTKVFLESFRAYLAKNEMLIEEKVDYSSIKKNQYKDIEFNKVLFCEGSEGVNNPIYEKVKFRRNKGDLITITSNELKTNEMFKKQAFILPIGNNQFKVGATYDRFFEDETPSTEKANELKRQLENMTKAKYTLVKHESGIRPAMIDRRPVLGKCENSENHYVFNGLGSRGCFMAPKLATEMVDLMENDKQIRKTYNIERFY
jgi:glycine/D-amino acid oxidase-like deaminating enzyme